MTTYSFDLHRMIFGDLPGLFYLEIALRTTLMFLCALFLLRIMGKRSLSQLSPLDLVIIIALGSAVGDPMFYADVPMLPAMVAIVVVVALERLVAHATLRNRGLASFIDSSPTVVIRDGVIDLKALRGEVVSLDELHATLREHSVESLDEIELAVLEPSGQLSILKTGADRSSSELWTTRPGGAVGDS